MYPFKHKKPHVKTAWGNYFNKTYVYFLTNLEAATPLAEVNLIT